jgi:hypothetical protein
VSPITDVLLGQQLLEGLGVQILLCGTCVESQESERFNLAVLGSHVIVLRVAPTRAPLARRSLREVVRPVNLETVGISSNSFPL